MWNPESKTVLDSLTWGDSEVRNVILVFLLCLECNVMDLWFGYLNAYSIMLSIVMRNECCSVKGLSSRMKTKPLTIFRYRKIPKISPGLISFKGPF